MKETDPNWILAGPYRGMLAPGFRDAAFVERLSGLRAWEESAQAVTLSLGRNRLYRIPVVCGERPLELAVKRFGPQSALKDWSDRIRGGKACRSWRAAGALRARGLGTPDPVGFLEKWQGRRLRESYFLTRYVPDLISFKDALIALFTREPLCATFLELMQAVADAVRPMHEAGFMHRDLGNQNILLRRAADGQWRDVQFADLNRARWQDGPLSVEQRARDLSRLYLPSDLWRVFLDMYAGAAPADRLRARERFHRKAYALLADTRHLRHPWRTRRNRRRAASRTEYPSEKEMWIWDERSEQAVSALRRKERARYFAAGRHAAVAAGALRGAPVVWREYRRLLKTCWRAPVRMAERVGMAVQPRVATWEREYELLRQLGAIPVLIRFYAHETPDAWRFAARAARQMHEAGRSVSFALVQDRRAVTDEARWREFVDAAVDGVADFADRIEIGHAINRVKWGVWEMDDYRRLLRGTQAARARWPHIKWTGPAVIDFDCPTTMAALRAMPPDLQFEALSLHLYVDRRGAPENRQGPFAALEKFALGRAMARWAPQCADRLIVSEVNWPLQGTGVYSPVGSPYVSPGPRRNDPSVSEEDYAVFMLRYLTIALCSGMVERVFWWRLVARGFGLVDNEDPRQWRARPAFHMLRVFLERIGDSQYVGLGADDTDAARLLRFRRSDGREWALAYSVGAPVSWEAPFRCARIENALGEVQPLATPAAPRLSLTGQPHYLFPAENAEV
jgi:hypothetical protein